MAERELLVGFYRKHLGRVGMTYKEAVDQALCFGWIDGVRRRVDTHTYSVRFSPRKSRSTWSRLNTKRAEELMTLGLMHPTGLKAFSARKPDRTGIYSFENKVQRLSSTYEREFRASRSAWNYFESRPPWYRRTASFWVMSAKKEETRQRRLKILIQDSASGRTIRPLTRPGKA